MILANLAKAVREQNYYAVVLEFLIVIAGVVIGFQIQGWSEARTNREIGERYIQRLNDDLNNELSRWIYVGEYYRQAREHARSALEGYLISHQTLDETFLIDLYQASQQWNFTVPTGTYEELLSTGRIEHLGNADLRRTLSNHYDNASTRLVTLGDSSDYRRIVREHMDFRVQTAIRERCDDQYFNDLNNFNYIALPELCEVSFNEEFMREEIARLHGQDLIKRALTFHLSILDSRINSLNNAIESTQSTLESIIEGAE